ncbi:hypothetical protein N7478_009230 [Penicillium angulare]|uniref:uncharacterized protein n=1 Tax=Penicillium angulare TaxID=116970 RepID=UPI00254038DE|nr:uncharacterized protein N7478_009230 [Penicillium angulare]KAJ5274105.1 hypothetical protein N7478_009230 [Penicillium angulare]
MKNTMMNVALFVTMANAFVSRSDSCCFQLTASGGASGSLGQLDDGQVRVGDSSLSTAEFCLSNTIITDSEGRGCVITSETTQFQCDEGSTGTSGFYLTSSGLLRFDSSSSFVACQTGENNGRNVYTTNSTSVTDCVNIQLTSNSCYAASSSSRVLSSASVATSPIPSSSPAVSPVVSSTPSITSSRPLVSTNLVSQTSLTTTPIASTKTSTSKDVDTATTSASSSHSASTAPVASSAAGLTSTVGFMSWIASTTLAIIMTIVY